MPNKPSLSNLSFFVLFGLTVTAASVPAVIRELDDVVVVTGVLSGRDEREERSRLLLAINHHAPLEEPVSAVLAERVQDVATGQQRKGILNQNLRYTFHVQK